MWAEALGRLRLSLRRLLVSLSPTRFLPSPMLLLPWLSREGLLPSSWQILLLLVSLAPAGILMPPLPSLPLLELLLIERRSACSREFGDPGADRLARGLLPPLRRAPAGLTPAAVSAASAALPEVAARRLQLRRAPRGETISPSPSTSSSSLSPSAGATLEDLLLDLRETEEAEAMRLRHLTATVARSKGRGVARSEGRGGVVSSRLGHSTASAAAAAASAAAVAVAAAVTPLEYARSASSLSAV